MHRTKPSLTLIIVALGWLACGCTSDLRVLNPDVAPWPVIFESDQCRLDFVEEIRDRYDDGDAVLPPGQLSKHAYFNREVERADSDADGIISDAEANHYIHQQ